MNEQDTCRWFESNLNGYLDGELDREARERMNEHARLCPECGQKLETMTRLLTMCAELDEGLVIPPEVKAAWRRAVRREVPQRGRAHRVGAWTRSMGWIAAALTFLVVSTALFSTDPGTVLTAPQSARFADAPGVGVSRSSPLPGDFDEYGQADSDTITLKPDGPLEELLGQTTVAGSGIQSSLVILRTATRNIETTAYDTDSQSIDNLVDEYEGYYESDTQSGQPLEAGSSGRDRHMDVRVPSAQLDEFLTGLDVIGASVYKNQIAQDISSQYYDTAVRLDALKLQRDQINKLIESATDLTAVVDLSDKFYELQAQIDSLEGRIRGWDNQADYAQVSVRLREVAVRDQVHSAGDSLIDRIRAGFYDSLNWLIGFLQDMAVTLAALAPILVVVLPVVVLIVVIVKVARRRRRR